MPPKNAKPISFEGAIKDKTVNKDMLPIIHERLHNAGVQSFGTQAKDGKICVTLYGKKVPTTITIIPDEILKSPNPNQALADAFAL